MSEGALPSASPNKKNGKNLSFFCFIKIFALSLCRKPKAIAI